MLLVPGPGPAGDVLKVALFQGRHRECVRILVILACFASFRRGRSAITFTFGKVTSPIYFLLWCLGLTRRRDHTNGVPLLHWNSGRGINTNNPPQRTRARRGGWRGALIGRDGPDGESELVSNPQGESVGSGAVRAAALGERGRQFAFEGFRQLRLDGACCDVTLAVGGAHFKAHRCVLAAQSSPMRAMFEGSFREGSEDVIALQDVEPSSFSLLLDFLYGRSVEITEENVEALLDLSARYGVSLLRRHCCAFMAGSADPSKACSLLAVADRYDCRRLRRELLAYTLECFPLACCGDNSSSDGFLQLSSALVAEVLKDDRLFAGGKGEVKVFWAAVSWLEADSSRRRDADEVLSHVRFGLVSAKTLADVVEAHPLMQSEAGRAFVHEAYRFQALPPESRDELASSMASRARPRTATARADGVVPCPSTFSSRVGVGVTAGRDGGRRRRRFLSTELRSNRPNSSSCAAGGGGGVEGLAGRWGGSWSEDGDALSGDDDEGEIVGSGEGALGDVTDLGGEEVGRRAAGLDGSASGGGEVDDGGGGTPPALGDAEESTIERAAGGEAGREGRESVTEVVSPRKSHTTESSVGRRSWGAGLRMYV